MKSIVIQQSGGLDTLQEKESPDMKPMPGMLTIDVVYAGVGYVDVMMRRGEFGPLVPFPLTPGLEVSGYVREISDGVEGFYIGQPVAAMTLGTYGGYASIVQARPEFTIPLDQAGAAIDMATAAAAIVNLTTAYMAVRHVGKVRPGDQVLIHGAAGGLGSYLGQVAKWSGAGKVYGTVGSMEKLQHAASFGYDELFVRSDFVKQIRQATEQQGVHSVFDPVGGEMRKMSLEVLRSLGQLVVVGNASGKEDVMYASNELWIQSKTVSGFALGVYAQFAPEEVGRAAREALQLIANHGIHTEIFGIYPFEKAAEAHAQLEAGNTVGKLLLQM
ncbi:quinone oxidoreductase family protein [Paenibacillus sedimenti]|uniref:Zinc-binding dehydrogenase n=1 Tax=Paenibacillus sedimenti TaxID=2770274 RepID=A0A926KQR1_9BACL|nr:zinc-binding dehydrogenase [Paenibacillus sedimenti]MBD0381421.1 zinc-binding dehydrogenase [Paenibacillus sedimenti]